MPRSLQASKIRNAISPRLAIRIFSNMAVRMTDDGCQMTDDCGFTRLSSVLCHLTSVLSFYNHQRLAKLHRLRVLEQDLDHRAGLRCGNLVEGLHRLDDQERIARLDRGAHVAEWLGARLGRPIGSADHGRCHHTWMLGRIEGDRKSTRLNSSHANISYAVFCLKKQKRSEQSKPHAQLETPV